MITYFFKSVKKKACFAKTSSKDLHLSTKYQRLLNILALNFQPTPYSTRNAPTKHIPSHYLLYLHHLRAEFPCKRAQPRLSNNFNFKAHFRVQNDI